MEAIQTSVFTLVLGGLLLTLAFAFGLHNVYQRGLRRYERVLDDVYSMRFEQRALIARSFHADLAGTIERSKLIVDQMREKPLDVPQIQDALSQVSDCLERAAAESDCALRSLEGIPMEGLNNCYIVGGAHVDSKTDSHHDR
jgi:hypothetical protein